MAVPFERLQHFLLIVGSSEELIEKIDTPFAVLLRQSRYIAQHAQNFLLVRFDDAKRTLQGVTRCTVATDTISIRHYKGPVDIDDSVRGIFLQCINLGCVVTPTMRHELHLVLTRKNSLLRITT